MSSGQLDVMKQCDEMCTENPPKTFTLCRQQKISKLFFKTVNGDLTIIQQVFWDG